MTGIARGQYGIVALLLTSATALAYGQGPSVAPPAVIAAEVPLYPALARAANVEGTIHVEVTTDGHRVTAARSRDGYRILADAAVKNAQTWEFATHEPTTFTITYRYRLVAKLTRNLLGPTVILRLPTEVEVLAMPRVINDPPP